MNIYTKFYSRGIFILIGMLILPEVLAQSGSQSVNYAGYIRPTSTVVELKLSDTVSPELIDYYFYRFGYNIIEHDIRPVKAIIHRSLSQEKLLQIAQHPYIEEIRLEYALSDSSITQNPTTHIRFKHSATDEMIHGFLAIHSGLNIELLPRAEKRVVVKAGTWRSERFVNELKMLVYVKEATLLSPYTP